MSQIIRIIIPHIVHPVLLFVFLSPIVFIVAYIIIGTRPYQQVVDVSTATIAGSFSIRIETLVINGTTFKTQFTELHIPTYRVSNLIQSLIGILSFIINMRQRRTEASIFTGLADADVIIGNETCLQEILKVVFTFRYQWHLFPFISIRVILYSCTADVQFITPNEVGSGIFTSLTGTVSMLYFRQYQITGIEHRTAVYRNIKSLLTTFLRSHHNSSRTSAGTIQGRCGSPLQHINRFDIVCCNVIQRDIAIWHTIYYQQWSFTTQFESWGCIELRTVGYIQTGNFTSQ